jgi:hypothetical protein
MVGLLVLALLMILSLCVVLDAMVGKSHTHQGSPTSTSLTYNISVCGYGCGGMDIQFISG